MGRRLLALPLLASLLAFAPAGSATASPAGSAERAVDRSLARLHLKERRVRCARSGGSTSFACRWRGRRASGGKVYLCRGRWRARTGAHRATVRRSRPRCAIAGVVQPVSPARAAKPVRSPIAPKSPVVTGPTSGAKQFLFGFNDSSINFGLATAAQSAALQTAAGANAQRIGVDWRWVEPYQDRYQWALYDAQYAAARASGIKPVFMLLFAPSWALDGQCDQFKADCTYPPTREHLADWREFVSLLVKRYPGMAGVEVWNEPNVRWFWKPAPDPALYVDLLREARSAVKAADPSIPVAGGSLANTETTDASNMSMTDFMRAIYRRGAKDLTDAISVHPYPNSLDTSRVVRNLNQIRGVLSEFGDVGKALWVTEVGLSSKGTAQQFKVTESEQATGLTAIYRTLRAQPDVQMALFHTLVEPKSSWYANPADPRDNETGYGVLRQDLSPKPAYCALAAARGRPACR